MLLVIDTLNQDRFSETLDDMFRLRERVLGHGDIRGHGPSNGSKPASFEKRDPAYLVSLDSDFDVVGCACLLPATGPRMASVMLRNALNGEPSFEHDTTWVCTAFCVDPNRSSASYTTCEIMIGILEHARNSGITDIIAVTDPQMNLALRRSATAPCSYLGCKAGRCDAPTVAALIDCSDGRIGQLRAFAGIEGEIFISDDEVEAAMQPPVMTSLASALQDYCTEQIAAASTRQEMIDAFALRRALKGRFQPKSGCDA